MITTYQRQIALTYLVTAGWGISPAPAVWYVLGVRAIHSLHDYILSPLLRNRAPTHLYRRETTAKESPFALMLCNVIYREDPNDLTSTDDGIAQLPIKKLKALLH